MSDKAPPPAPPGTPPRSGAITGQIPLRRARPQQPTPPAAPAPPAPTPRAQRGQITIPHAPRVRLAQAQAMVRALDFAGAEVVLRELLQTQPPLPGAQHSLATVLYRTHRWAEAEALWRAVCQARPDDPHALNGHAAALVSCERYADARATLEGLLKRWPDFEPARLNLASLLRQNYQRPGQALAVLAPAVEANPGNPDLHFAIGRAKLDLLDPEGALSAYQQALALDPCHFKALGASLFCAHYLPEPDLDAVRRLGEHHGRLLHEQAGSPPRPAAMPPGERLRVGMVSGDLTDHPVAYFLESVLRALHQRPVDVFAYANVHKTDAVSRRLQASTHTWRPVAALTDTQLAEQMREDRLDVLLDLSGYTNHHRLGALMQRPAPLQLGWLGYFGTLGLPAVDGVVADPHCVPPAEESFFSERLLHMPHTRLCMSAPAHAPEVPPLPPLATRPGLRFGCFQNLQKLNRRVLAAWRRILDGAPGATLLLQSRQMGKRDTRAAFDRLLAESGIDLARVELRKPSKRGEYLAQYAEVDVLLDTFPYPGGTSTAEALWMGVPTLTLATPGMLGRQGQAMLHSLGLEQWITHSDGAYVARAIDLANHREQTLHTLTHLRATLRDTARRSPLFDAETFARDFEALLRRACIDNAQPRP